MQRGNKETEKDIFMVERENKKKSIYIDYSIIFSDSWNHSDIEALAVCWFIKVAEMGDETYKKL